MGEMGLPHMGKKGCWDFFCFFLKGTHELVALATLSATDRGEALKASRVEHEASDDVGAVLMPSAVTAKPSAAAAAAAAAAAPEVNPSPKLAKVALASASGAALLGFGVGFGVVLVTLTRARARVGVTRKKRNGCDM